MIRLGLTGSIATGKSTTAHLFAEEGAPVHDADAAVHAIYDQEGIGPVSTLIPSALKDGTIDRKALKAALQANPQLLPRLEAIVHPLVHTRETDAATRAEREGHDVMVFDIPLLFETGGQARMDKTIVTYCAPQIQRLRLMERPGMTDETARMLMDRQMPQAEKRARADFEISTDHGLDAARADVRRILKECREGLL
ncbi:MAG: dephospho-CoA kinase [Pseudomonadota bacterium]